MKDYIKREVNSKMIFSYVIDEASSFSLNKHKFWTLSSVNVSGAFFVIFCPFIKLIQETRQVFYFSTLQNVARIFLFFFF